MSDLFCYFLLAFELPASKSEIKRWSPKRSWIIYFLVQISIIETVLGRFGHFQDFPRLKPNIFNFRDYKGFVNDFFNLSYWRKLTVQTQRVLDKHATLKIYVAANQKSFMDGELNQAIMVRSKLWNKYLKSKSETDKQRHQGRETTVLSYCVLKSRNIMNALISIR